MHLTEKEEDCVNFLTAYDVLVDMGFKKEQITEALVVSSFNLGPAVDYLSK